jgi:hypothetical protein
MSLYPQVLQWVCWSRINLKKVVWKFSSVFNLVEMTHVARDLKNNIAFALMLKLVV